MSHVAVILTSEQCGHCRVMRGNGRLLSGNEIKGKQPNIPGGYHYDAVFMKKLITAETEIPRIRVVNIHYKTFDHTKGVTDISVFMLDSDNKTVKQTMLKENKGKTNMTLYSIGESGKVVMSNDIDKSWSDIVSEYIPVNIPAYSFFFPSVLLFEGKAWTEGISQKKPIYGYLNGFEPNPKLPYGAIPGPQPRTMEWSKFLKQFFDGTKELLGTPKDMNLQNPENLETPQDSRIESQSSQEHREVVALDVKPQILNSGEVINTATRNKAVTSASKKLGFKLYVVE